MNKVSLRKMVTAQDVAHSGLVPQIIKRQQLLPLHLSRVDFHGDLAIDSCVAVSVEKDVEHLNYISEVALYVVQQKNAGCTSRIENLINSASPSLSSPH